ncbi:hypothetical protein D7030_07600 [Flavobacteriaceae bacterium AU392]|nr:hypothetical protein D1817_00820 [Flavobacteriaceae bacterium]RKM84987.1 hypothetical protein D7030_07600 [Flavobacteriaceae bacterium AU392]
MKKLTYLFIVFLFVQNKIIAQNGISKPQKAIINYFELPREQIYLHLNKSTYVTGEELWFKGYFFDFLNQVPSTATTNLHIGLYDTNGKQIQKKLFLGFNGNTNGSFSIDSLLQTGEYYVKASTNWGRNFKEDHSYTQKIKVFNPKNGRTSSPTKRENVSIYDFQFLPEGGHLIEGVENYVGVKLINSKGKGISFNKATIYDENKDEITSFKSNSFGLGKFSIFLKPNMQYNAKIELYDGTILTEKLPHPKQNGLAIIVINTHKDKVFLKLNTNENTFSNIKGKPYKLMFHQGDKSIISEVVFKQNLSVEIAIGKSELFKGVNIITLFNEKDQPLIERVIFNDYNLKTDKIIISEAQKLGDSIEFNLKLNSSKNSIYNLSISTLPQGTISYAHDKNILSTFSLNPYLKGYVENAAYYFQNITKKKKYELDLLLLTQGWSQYNWNNVFNFSPVKTYDFETGLSINSLINNNVKEKKKALQLYIHLTESQGATLIDVNKDNTILIKNLYFKKGEVLKTSLIRADKKVLPTSSVFEIKPRLIIDSIVFSSKNPKINLNHTTNLLPTSIKPFFSKNITELDEVLIKGKKKKDDNESSPFISGSPDRFTKITQREVSIFPRITDLIRYKGYDVIDNLGRVEIVQRFGSTLSGSGRLSPLLFVNGIATNNLGILASLRTSDIEDIYVNPRDISQGPRGAGGVIRINLRKTFLPTSNTDNTSQKNYAETIINNGFEVTKRFYTPKYNTYLNNAFDNYGVIHWTPEISVKNDETITFRTVDIPNKTYVFHIEGMSNKGELISQSIKIQR